MHRWRPRHRAEGRSVAGITFASTTEVVSLPMHAYLDEAMQDRVIAAVLDSFDVASRKAA